MVTVKAVARTCARPTGAGGPSSTIILSGE